MHFPSLQNVKVYWVQTLPEISPVSLASLVYFCMEVTTIQELSISIKSDILHNTFFPLLFSKILRTMSTIKNMRG